MANPKTLKLVLRGEVPEPAEIYEIAGEVFRFENSRKIVVPSKKNQQVISINETVHDDGTRKLTPVLLPSKQHQDWHKEHLPIFRHWKNHMITNHGVRIPIVRAKLKILFYFPDSKDRDLGNKAETIYDIMRDTGIIADDQFKVLKPITLDGWTQRDKPRTEIYLTLVEPDSPEYDWDLTNPAWHQAAKERLAQRQRCRRLLKRQSNQD